MKPDDLAASLGIALTLIVLYQRGLLARAWSAFVPLADARELMLEYPELEAGNAQLSRAYELTREAIEKARAAS